MKFVEANVSVGGMAVLAGLIPSYVSGVRTMPSFSAARTLTSFPVARMRVLLDAAEGGGPIDALATSLAAQEAVGGFIAEAALELADLEGAVADELGLTTEELEAFADGGDPDQDPPPGTAVEALAAVMAAQEDASAALAEAGAEMDEIETDIATELGVTVDELALVEDGDDATS